MIVLERECRNLSFRKFVKSVSPSCFEIVSQTHARVSQLISRQMFDHFEEVELSKTLEKLWNWGGHHVLKLPLGLLQIGFILFSNSNFLQMVVL